MCFLVLLKSSNSMIFIWVNVDNVGLLGFFLIVEVVLMSNLFMFGFFVNI